MLTRLRLNFTRKMHVKPIKMRWATGGVNYSYLLSTQDRKESWLVDPAETDEVLDALTEEELNSITAIVNTHHHYDHADGNEDMIRAIGKSNIKVITGSKQSVGTTDVPEHLDKYQIGDDIEVRCIRTPCHTQDSICYYARDEKTNEKCIFTGDTLFTGGCGRFFEGSGKEMDIALNERILGDVGESNWKYTSVYPGHEYTRSNAMFIRKYIYPQFTENLALDRLEKYCSKHEVTTGMFNLFDETEFNPFMRLNDPFVRQAVGDKDNSMSRADVMAKLRELKNNM